MKAIRIIIAVALTALIAACSKGGSEADSRIAADYEARREALAATGIFAPLDTMTLTADERRAMQFVYAYSPLPDIVDRSPEFMLANVRAAIDARAAMGWDVPDREWLHFVLPVRINNEPLDSARLIFYPELRERVAGMSMADAILEVNHWAHEKATYQPSDGRTRSPLQTVAAAIGRCGEESTLLVAALRSIGIPARQVYTPRWAHTDDNHAWVEAWADGKWHFLGACEPEPVLDLGWFNAPASRGMLMNTRVFGAYDGPEDVLTRGPGYTVINVTDNYAPTRRITAEVTDSAGKPLEGATVAFGLYNYAEFYPLASLATDGSGRASLTTGLGDILLWASDGERYAFAKASASDTLVRLTPSAAAMLAPGAGVDLDIEVPAPSANLPEVTAAQRAENDRRFAAEDSIRRAYMASAFISAADLSALPAELRPLAAAMKSNHRLLGLAAEEGRTAADIIPLLTAISEKDLGDAPYALLSSALGRPYTDTYIINPRISTEELTPWWTDLAAMADSASAAAFRADPSLLEAFVADSIALVAEQWEPANVHMSPAGVWRTRMADPASRDIFFVAAARTLGIPARLDPVTSVPQWRDSSGEWHDALRPAPAIDGPRARLSLLYTDSAAILPDPQYYTHFTISRLDGGLPTLLTYDEGSASAATTFGPAGSPLAPGDYIITTGRRMANGNVLAAIDMVRIGADNIAAPLRVRSSAKELQVIGSFNSEDRFLPLGATDEVSILSQTGRGYYTLGILDTSEPSIHALNDLAAAAAELEADGRKIIILAAEGTDPAKLMPSQGTLPANVIIGTDPSGRIAAEISEAMHLKAATGHLPVIIVADTFNRVVSLSEGYTIGLGHTLLDTLSRLRD